VECLKLFPGNLKAKGWKKMRSEDVFAAAKKISNRFLLCRVASVSAHHLQAGPKAFTESINQSLKLIAGSTFPANNGSVAGQLPMSIDHLFLTPKGDVRSEPSRGDQTFEPLLAPLTVG
jgi:hypothetical protein